MFRPIAEHVEHKEQVWINSKQTNSKAEHKSVSDQFSTIAARANIEAKAMETYAIFYFYILLCHSFCLRKIQKIQNISLY